jgi:Uma2 family endonuclease
VVQNLSASLIGALRDGTRRVLVQQSVKLRTGDTARPDICVLCDAEALSSKSRSRRDAIQLIVEVWGNALQYEFDRLERYALAGVAEVWIVDLQRHRLLAYQAPSGNSFAKRQLLVAPERMGISQLPKVELKVAWIFC